MAVDQADSRSTMERFLAKLRDLLRGKASDGNLSAEEFDAAVRQARSSVGGIVRGEKRRAERDSAPESTETAEVVAYESVDDLPEGVRGALPEEAQKVWLAAHNAAAKKHPANGKACQALAWGAIKSAGYHPGEGGWTRASEAPDIDLAKVVSAVEASVMSEFRLLSEVALAEDGKSFEVQIFPRVGTYQHPRYGELRITPAFLKQVQANFAGRVYQQDVPLTIDLEHQTALSGAAGWIESVEVRGEDGLWARGQCTERGQALLADDAYRYFSPEYYDKWTDPASGKEYSNVLIGGALTNRPFFKGMAPVVMTSEGVFAFAELAAGEAPEGGKTTKEQAAADPMAAMQAMMGMMSQMAAMMPADMRAKADAMMAKARALMPQEKGQTATEGSTEQEVTPMGMTEDEARKLTELADSVKTLTEQVGVERTARQAAEATATAATERVAALERDAKRREFGEFVRANRLAFRGEVPAAVDQLEKFAKALPAEDFQAYLDERAAQHRAMAESTAFQTMGGPGTDATGPQAAFDAAVARVMSERSLPKGEAIKVVATEQPALYGRVERAHNVRARRGEE